MSELIPLDYDVKRIYWPASCGCSCLTEGHRIDRKLRRLAELAKFDNLNFRFHNIGKCFSPRLCWKIYVLDQLLYPCFSVGLWLLLLLWRVLVNKLTVKYEALFSRLCTYQKHLCELTAVEHATERLVLLHLFTSFYWWNNTGHHFHEGCAASRELLGRVRGLVVSSS